MLIKVKVNPNSQEEEIRQLSNDEYIISLKGLEDDSDSNFKIMKIFSKKYGVDLSKIKIRNPSSKFKLIEIQF